MTTIEVQLDRPRQLRFTIKALRHLQRMAGMPLGPFAEMLGQTSIEAYVQALVAGLEHELPDVTTEQVAELLQMALDQGRSLKEIATKITEALIASGLFEARKNGAGPIDLLTPTS